MKIAPGMRVATYGFVRLFREGGSPGVFCAVAGVKGTVTKELVGSDGTPTLLIKTDQPIIYECKSDKGVETEAYCNLEVHDKQCRAIEQRLSIWIKPEFFKNAAIEMVSIAPKDGWVQFLGPEKEVPEV